MELLEAEPIRGQTKSSLRMCKTCPVSALPFGLLKVVKDLADVQDAAGGHEGGGSVLAAVVAHELELGPPVAPIGGLGMDGRAERGEPVGGFGGDEKLSRELSLARSEGQTGLAAHQAVHISR